MEKLCTQRQQGIVTKEQAIEDVETVFKLLKAGYGGYKYFGGDELFNQAKQQILDEIKSGNDSLTSNDLVQMLIKYLSFFSDTHLSFNRMSVGQEAYCFYEDGNMVFYKDHNGYYTKKDGDKWYLESDYEKYMKITISTNGELVYGMFNICTKSDKDKSPDTIKFKDNHSSKVSWSESSIGKNSESEYKYSVKKDVPCQELSVMNFATDGANKFIDDAKKLAKASHSIVDMRVNSGGMPMNDYFWFYNYTGELNDVNRAYMQRVNDVNKTIENQTTKSMWNESVDSNNQLMEAMSKYNILKGNSELTKLIEEYAKSDYYDNSNSCVWKDGFYNLNKHKMLDNANTLFVLQGKDNISAGESFVLLSKNVRNTLRVGTNTNGCLHTAPIAMVNLPNSGVVMVYSCGILVGDDKDFDTFGIEPDIYIGGQDAKSAVQKCIEYYQ